MSAPVQQNPSQPCVTDLLRQLRDMAAREDHLTIGTILNVFGVHSFAFLILAISILNVVIFMIPLISILFGLPMVILAAQMVIGLRTPVLPRVIRRQPVRSGPLIDGVDRAIRGIDFLERFIKPRLEVLSAPELMRIHSLAMLIMAAMVTLPIPVLNVPPSVGLIFLSLGILQRDGIFIVIGYLIGGWCLWLFKSLGHFAHAVASR